ncbi:energy transducer TonB [Parasphingopyxis sp.]|uniref:energy transducer TonB n=1 Tax=Parasphingopyxis sp. TaxID=1920299 RepID=UPI00263A0F1D|nr:energy transducer TonB [Parasphingopyxis sp.]
MGGHNTQKSGYLNQSRHSSSGLAIVIALHGAALAAAFLVKSGVVPAIVEPGPIEVVNVVPSAPPPAQQTDPMEPEVRLPNTPTVSDPIVDVPTYSLPPLDIPRTPEIPRGETLPTTPEAMPDPVIRTARFASRANVQPRYPSSLLRQDVEGSCTIRVRIAPSGRVVEARPVSATHPAFCDATERQALRNWRFEPATRDGVPIESWQEHTVEFRIS